MKKKLFCAVMASVLTMSLAVGCGKSEAGGTEKEEKSSGGDVEISFYTTETGKDEMFQNAISKFEADNPGIKVEYIAAGDDQLQKWMSLYASNEGPTVSFMDPINIYENQERMRVFEKEECPWLDNIYENAFGCFTYDGKIYGVPGSAAGIGLVYNKDVLDKAVGGEFDPATIKSQSDLKELFDKIEATGAAGSMFTGVNWSLGSHFLGINYGEARGDVEEREAFLAEEKAGKAKLKDDEVFNNFMDTFDLIAEYNYNKEDPLVGNVNLDAEALARGEVGTWFMGDWAWTYIGVLDNVDADFGILQVPVNDDENDRINTIIPTSYAKGYCVDASQNTEEQQEAGMKFVEYITSNEEVLKEFGDVCGQVFPYKNFPAESVKSPLGQATAKYIEEGKNYDFYGTANMLPSDFWYENGAFMCEYLSGACDRAALADNIDNYWKGVK